MSIVKEFLLNVFFSVFLLLPPHSRMSVSKIILKNMFSLTDERILEYDIDKVLFDKRSPFQKVQIVHSKSLGNMLVLDELQSKLRCWSVTAYIFVVNDLKFRSSIPVD